MGFRKILDESLVRFLNVLPEEYSHKVSTRLYKTLGERQERYPPHYDLVLPEGEGSLRVKHSDTALWSQQNWHGAGKELETMRWIKDHIGSDEKLFDIGASIGLYSLYAAKMKKIQVYAFEPEIKTFQNLIANINLNHCASLVSPYNIALSDKSQLGVLCAGYPYHHSRTFIPEKDNVPRDAKLLHPIMSMTLDDFLALFQLPPPDHIKLDVDGLELEILHGAGKTLTQIRTLMIEVEQDLAENAERDLLPFLRDLDFEENPIADPQSGRNRFFINKNRDLRAYYAAEPVEVVHPALLIRVNKKYRHAMSAKELYEVTRGVWRLGPRRERAKYAMAVFEGVVKEVYKIQSWHAAGTTTYETRSKVDVHIPKRWEFLGEVAPPEIRSAYLDHSVRGHFKRGAQNPVVYVNC